MIIDNLKKWITSNYNKDVGSNISKTLFVISEEIEEPKKAFNDIQNVELITANGDSLDKIGENVLQFRGGESDSIYRKMIVAKKASNKSGGEIETLNFVLDAFMGESFSGIKECWGLSNSPEPSCILIEYENLEEILSNDSKKLDGSFKLDGKIRLDNLGVSEIFDKLKIITKFIVSAGVKIIWTDISSASENLNNVIHELMFEFKTFIEHLIEKEAVNEFKFELIANNSPKFLLDGVANLDGTYNLDSIKNLITHSTEIIGG